jgi:hypothetical protein
MKTLSREKHMRPITGYAESSINQKRKISLSRLAGLVSAQREQAKRADYWNENTTATSSSKVTVSNQKKNPGPPGTLGG